MNRGFSYLPMGKRQSPPRRDRVDLSVSRRPVSNRSRGIVKEDLNIDDFGDMDSDEDDFQTLAANFVPSKPPVQPQYNLVPFGFLRDDDKLVDEDYDGVPISDSPVSSPIPESPAPSRWKSSPRKEEIKGNPITVLGSGNRPNLTKWTNDGRSHGSAQSHHLHELGSSMGAHSSNKISHSLGAHNSHLGSGRWDQTASILPGNTRNNIPSFMGKEVAKVQTSVRAQDDRNPFLNKSQTPSGNSQIFVRPKDDRDSFLHTSFGQTSSGSSTKDFVPAKSPGYTFPQPSAKQTVSGTSTGRFPASNVGNSSTQSNDKPSTSWNDPTKSVEGVTPAWSGQSRKPQQSVKEQIMSSATSQMPSQIEMLQATALQQAFTGIAQLDPQTGLSLLMQASQNPTLAVALLSTIKNAGLVGSTMTSSSNTAIDALVKSAGSAPTPVAAASVTQPNLSGLRQIPTPDGSGATRYPAPDLSSLVFDPSTGYRYDGSTGLHYDANSGYFFNSKLKIYLRWDKFTQTYLRVENPPGASRFIFPSVDTPVPSLVSQGGAETFRSVQNPTISKETIPSSKVPPLGNFNQQVDTLNKVRPSTSSYDHSGGSHSSVESSYQPGEGNRPSAVEQKLASLPNLAETTLFNKLRKAKLAAQPKTDRKRWGEPDPLLEAVQKHASETSQSPAGVLNLEEILQRSRQFMKGTGGDFLTSNDGKKDRPTRAKMSPGRSEEERRIRSRSRSLGRQRRHSQSLEKLGTRRMKTSKSPQSSSGLSRGRSPDTRRGRPRSKGRSPINLDRGRSSPSPQHRRRRSPSRGRSPNYRTCRRPMSPEDRKRRSHSRGRSPNIEARRRSSFSPEARRKKSTSRGKTPNSRSHGKRSISPEARRRGRSPVRKRGKSSKSPDSKYRKSSTGKSSDRKHTGRLSKSPERKRHLSQTPDRTSFNKSPPAVVKVVLNKSPGGSKVGLRDEKRAANLLSADKRIVLRKFSSNEGVADKARDPSPGKQNVKSGGSRTDQKSLNVRLGLKDAHVRGIAKPSQEKEKVTELKPIPYDTPQASGNKSSKEKRSKDVSGYKSLSNLRNQSRNKLIEKETDMKRGSETRETSNKFTERQPSNANLTTEEDDERRTRNHRLVSERTFSNTWKTKKPEPVSQVLSSTKRESANRETDTATKNPNSTVGKNDNGDPGVSDDLEESNDFDFLNDTLDDDKDSTVIDEYEEILDYQDLDSNSESKVDDSTTETDLKPRTVEVKQSLSKESIVSVTELGRVPSERSIESSTSVDSARVSLQCSSVDGNDIVDSPRDQTIPAVRDGDTDLETSKENMKDCNNKDAGEAIDDKELKNTCDFSEAANPAESSKSLSEDIKIATSDEPTVYHERGHPLEDQCAKQRSESCSKGNDTAVSDESVVNHENIVKLADQCANESSENTIFDNNEWNVVDSVDDQEESLTTIVHAADKKPLDEVKGRKNVPNSILANAKAPTEQIHTRMESGGVVEAAQTSNVDQGKGSDPSTFDGKNNQCQVGSTTGVTVGLNAKTDDKNDLQTVVDEICENNEKFQGSADVKENSEIVQDDSGEPPLQVRSVSDIENFLLLSSQEVEAKRDQGIEANGSNKEKKSGIFSRLGVKLPFQEGSGSTAETELQPETSIIPENPSKAATSSVPPDKAKILKPLAPSGAAKKTEPEDPCKSLFEDEPTPTVLVGPMNFIEPLANFQHFTQKYMQNALDQENVRYKKIYVHHEDGTGAPYHYILITFQFAHNAADWVRKHKGIYKADPKIFKRTAGHIKHKFVPDAVAFLHFTEPNWICAVCKRSNFPPRSLCFGCFQNKDPDGFSPLILLDKGRPPFRHSKWVGTPKLKFFATKEKVIESAPPLDGFDIQRIEMIMDEEMGLPAGICVFELPTIIEAGKLKKYLNRRDVECVAVQMHEQYFENVGTHLPVVSESLEEQEPLPLDLPASGDDALLPLSEDIEGRWRQRDVLETTARSPRFSSREVRVTSRPPSTSQDRLSGRIQSQSPVRYSPGPRPPSVGYQPLRHEARLEQDKYPSPEARSVRAVISNDRSVRALSPNRDIEPSRYRSTERVNRSPLRQSPPRYHSRSPVRVSLKRRSSPPRSRSPLPRRLSPAPRRRSPPLQRLSPHKRPLSPLRRRSPSPRRRSLSPTRRSPPPKRRTPSLRRSPSPRRSTPPLRRRSPSAVRPIKPDGRSDWSYPPPDPKNFRFEPRSGLDYDPTTTLYYEPKSCCFYNDDSNEWLEYEPRSGCYRVVS